MVHIAVCRFSCNVHSGMPATTLTFDQAVTLPVVWTTAHYCFVQANIRSVQVVLVHAASGGVGLVSVEWASMARATAYATASSIAKHVVLRSCNIVNLSSSRSSAACTLLLPPRLQGRRLHSLVNALSSDLISVSLGLLASQGVFVEIGKNNIWSHGRTLASRPLVDFVAVAIDEGCRDCPGWNMDPWWFNRELRQLSARVQDEVVQSLLLEAIAFEEHTVQAAFRLLQRGANLGKVVVRVGQRASMAKKRQTASIEMQSLMHMPGRWQDAEPGTLIRLDMDAERGVAVVELNDPERFNTMGLALGYDLNCAVSHLRCLGGICALTMQGAGSTFCAGGNPYASGGSTLLVQSSRALLASVQGFVNVRGLCLPVVCVVHGAMIGGAAAIFLHADLRIAETEATFQHGNLSRGVCPIVGYSRTLQIAVGAPYARRYYLYAC